MVARAGIAAPLHDSALQRQFGYSMAGASLAVMVFNIVAGMHEVDWPLLQILFAPQVCTFFLGAVLGVVSGTVRSRATRILQVAIVLMIGYVAAWEMWPGNLTAFVFIALAVFLAWEYNHLQPYPYLKVLLVMLVYLGIIVANLGFRRGEVAAQIVVSVAGAVALGWFVWILVGARIRAQLRRTEELEAAVDDRTRELLQRTEEAEHLRDQVQTALQEQRTLLAELHHRTKNNLQLVSSMLDLEADTRLNHPDHASLEAAKQRIKSLATVHDKLYFSSRPGEIDLSSYLLDYAEEIGSIAQVFNAHIDAQADGPVLIETDRAIRLAVVVNELVMNAVEHAAGGETLVTVGLVIRSTAHEAVVTISDDGPGMDVANDRAQYGVSLVRQLAGQLQGRADVTSSGGTRWEIAVPLHAAAEMAS